MGGVVIADEVLGGIFGGKVASGVLEKVVTDVREEAEEVGGLLFSFPEFSELDAIKKKKRKEKT